MHTFNLREDLVLRGKMNFSFISRLLAPKSFPYIGLPPQPMKMVSIRVQEMNWLKTILLYTVVKEGKFQANLLITLSRNCTCSKIDVQCMHVHGTLVKNITVQKRLLVTFKEFTYCFFLIKVASLYLAK